MGQYSIKELEKLSGIKAHTIRIWEKRYNIVEPQRTQTNIRLYSDDDLRKIINVSLLNTHGIKISRIADMSDHELNEKVLSLSQSETQMGVHIDRLVTCMLELDEQKFVDELSILEDKFGFEQTMTGIIYAFLEKIGILWQTGSITPAHEHFISNLIRQRLIVAIAKLPIPSASTLRVVLFLPENELHEIGLLFYHYLARSCGFKTYYLGQSVPHNDLKTVYETHKPHLLITAFISSPKPQELNDYLKLLSRDFAQSKILASGLMLRRTSFIPPANFKAFDTVLELKTHLESMK